MRRKFLGHWVCPTSQEQDWHDLQIGQGKVQNDSSRFQLAGDFSLGFLLLIGLWSCYNVIATECPVQTFLPATYDSCAVPWFEHVGER